MSQNFQASLEKYANLIINVGLNLQPGQRLLITDPLFNQGVPITVAPLVEQLVIAAYRAGARLVDVIWADENLHKRRFELAPRDSFEEFPTWQVRALLDYAERGDALLSVLARDPDLLSGYDSNLLSTAQRTTQQHLAPAFAYITQGSLNWCVVGAATEPWARKVFNGGDHPAATGNGSLTDQLWEAIFGVSRVYESDPVAAWRAHVKRLVGWSDYLNQKRYAALKYTAPGTELTVGLPPAHEWHSGVLTTTNERKLPYTPNIPTEEVFTMPHRDKVDGVVTATMPLSYGGVLIEGFTLRFEGGQVVHASAAKHEAILTKMLETDEGARRLGEVALVPHSSPISQRGLLFYNTLFDENASNHLALGRAYQFTMRDSQALTEEQFAAAGGNLSLIHVDFMMGNGKMDVDGITAEGSTEPLMRQGEWTFDVGR
jgi:aminopeptidase